MITVVNQKSIFLLCGLCFSLHGMFVQRIQQHAGYSLNSLKKTSFDNYSSYYDKDGIHYEPYDHIKKNILDNEIRTYENLFNKSNSKLYVHLSKYKTVQQLVDAVKWKAALEKEIFSKVYWNRNRKTCSKIEQKVHFIYDEPVHEIPLWCSDATKYISNILSLYQINDQKIDISYNNSNMFHGCAVMVQLKERLLIIDEKEYAKIALYVDEQQCLEYGFTYLIAHEAMHIFFKDVEYIYQLKGRIHNKVFMRYLQAIELRADMATLDQKHYLVNDVLRKTIIEQALRMHVQCLPKPCLLKSKPNLWDMQSLESTHPSALKRFAYFLRAKQLLKKQK